MFSITEFRLFRYNPGDSPFRGALPSIGTSYSRGPGGTVEVLGSRAVTSPPQPFWRKSAQRCLTNLVLKDGSTHPFSCNLQSDSGAPHSYPPHKAQAAGVRLMKGKTGTQSCPPGHRPHTQCNCKCSPLEVSLHNYGSYGRARL